MRTLKKPRQSYCSGLSLIEVVIAVAVLGVVAFTSQKSIVSLHAQAAHIKNRQEIAAVREYLNTVVSCDRTLVSYHDETTGTIDCPASIALKDRNGNNVADADGEPIALGWHVKVSCLENPPDSGNGVGLEVRAAKIKDGVVVKDTATGERLGYLNNRINPVFGARAHHLLCAAHFGAKARIVTMTPPVGSDFSDLYGGNCNLVLPDDNTVLTEDQKDLMARTADKADAGCHDSCVTKTFRSGYMVNCDDAKANPISCVCFR